MWKTETLFLCKLWREKRAIPIHITEWKSSNFYAKHKVKIEPFLRRVLRKIFLVIQIIRLDKKGVFLFGQSFLVTFLLFQNISVQVRLYAKNTLCPFSTLRRFNSYFNNSLRSLYLSIPLSPFQTSFIPNSILSSPFNIPPPLLFLHPFPFLVTPPPPTHSFTLSLFPLTSIPIYSLS